MDRYERLYNAKNRPERQYKFLIQPKSGILFGWKSEHHDVFSVQNFISFQGIIIDLTIPYNTKNKPYVTYKMGSTVHYLTKDGGLKVFQAARDIFVEIHVDPDIKEPWNAYRDGIYILNTLNPTPVKIETLWQNEPKPTQRA